MAWGCDRCFNITFNNINIAFKPWKIIAEYEIYKTRSNSFSSISAFTYDKQIEEKRTKKLSHHK